MQLDSWIKSGSMHSPNFSLIYVLLKPLTLLTTPIVAYKTTTVLASALFVVFITLYIRKKVGRIESIIVWLLCLSSPLLLFISHQFTKNLLGLNIVLLYFITDKKWYKTLLILILSFFTHRVTFVIFTIIALWDFSSLLKNRKTVLISLIGIITVLSFIPGLPNPFDYLRIIKEIELTKVWAPFEFFTTWNSKSFGFVWYLEAILTHVILLISLLFLKKKKENLALFFIILILLLPIYKFSTGSLGYRLYLNAFCLLFLLIPNLFKLAYAKHFVLLIALISLPFGIFSYNPQKFDPPIDSYKMIADKVNKTLKTTDFVSLIIAHKGIKEQIILRTTYDALNWQLNDTLIDDNCYRIVHGITDKEIIELQGSAQSEWKKLSLSYYITRESNWKQFLNALDEEGRYSRIKELKTWLNPYEIRPNYLR